jgi:hypothetical protein
MIEAFAGSLFVNQRTPVYYEPQVQPTVDPAPEPESTNTKVVRRMVYEETKVPKK